MRKIQFYRSEMGKCPVEEYFDSLTNKQLILNHAFTKKSQKIPQKEIAAAKKRKQDYLNPPRGKPRGIFTVRMNVYFQFAR